MIFSLSFFFPFLLPFSFFTSEKFLSLSSAPTAVYLAAENCTLCGSEERSWDEAGRQMFAIPKQRPGYPQCLCSHLEKSSSAFIKNKSNESPRQQRETRVHYSSRITDSKRYQKHTSSSETQHHKYMHCRSCWYSSQTQSDPFYLSINSYYFKNLHRTFCE